ncbi:MAG: response regulator [Clostridiales bacterium]|nr:response regulator [Clostridiales bacterium]
MKKIEVLVVDDEKDIYTATKMAMDLLEYEGIDVIVSYSDSADSAIEMIDINRYDLIFLDIIMETIHAGYTVIDYINKKCLHNQPSIFIRSGQPGNVPDEYMSLIDGIDGYIHKTDCTMDKLHEIVKSII